MNNERILSKITAVDPPKKNGAAAATATDESRLTTSPFTIDHEGEARAALIASLHQDALEEDKGAAVAAIEGDHSRKDRHTDKARCLRATAEHLAKVVVAVVLLFCLTSCESLKNQLGGLKVGVCYEDACVTVEVPKGTEVVVKEAGKEAVTVQP
jgi:hypothetical protein